MKDYSNHIPNSEVNEDLGINSRRAIQALT